METVYNADLYNETTEQPLDNAGWAQLARDEKRSGMRGESNPEKKSKMKTEIERWNNTFNEEYDDSDEAWNMGLNK